MGRLDRLEPATVFPRAGAVNGADRGARAARVLCGAAFAQSAGGRPPGRAVAEERHSCQVGQAFLPVCAWTPIRAATVRRCETIIHEANRRSTAKNFALGATKRDRRRLGIHFPAPRKARKSILSHLLRA